MDAAAEELSTGAPGADDRYATALDRWLALGGADLDERAAEIAADVGLGVGLDTPTTTLSGGQAARAGLVALLASRYDVLLLGEPTNDLDLDGLERLERFVRGRHAREAYEEYEDTLSDLKDRAGASTPRRLRASTSATSYRLPSSSTKRRWPFPSQRADSSGLCTTNRRGPRSVSTSKCQSSPSDRSE